ncbi:MAG: YdbH domain-containing protein [Candidatus Didemnitutus sp.]|nr:YdbH domain-containing protein [Candidatus Didemnitutus sp.]
MTDVPRSPRRPLLWLAAFVVIAVTGLVLLRRPLVAAAISSTLRMNGAGDVRLDVTDASPWFVEVKDLGFKVRTQRFDAKRVTVSRSRWWQPSLGAVRIEGAKVPVTLDGSDTNPWAWSNYAGSEPVVAPAELKIPAEQISLDGTLELRVAGQPAEDLTIKFEAKLGENFRWSGTVQARAPGLAADVAAEFDYPKQTLQFQLTRSEIDLQRWQGFIQQLVVLPGGKWDLAGILTVTAAGTYAEDKLAVNGRVQLRDGNFYFAERNVTASGTTADFTFTDFDRVVSEPGTVRVAKLDAGEIKVTNLDLELAFAGPEKIAVSRASLEALGGKLSAEPFTFYPLKNELDATLVVEGLVVEQIMALTKDVPAKAMGFVDGWLPIRIDGAGLRFGSGWLELKRGAYAEVRFNAAGLLTNGVSPKHASYPTLKKVESGLLQLKLTELRLDIRPPGAPPGRSATLRLKGEPVDPQVKAPVNLDLNVNGPLEQLLNLGMDGRIKFPTGR